jgi:hypothetical protein
MPWKLKSGSKKDRGKETKQTGFIFFQLQQAALALGYSYFI